MAKLNLPPATERSRTFGTLTFIDPKLVNTSRSDKTSHHVTAGAQQKIKLQSA